MNPPPGSAPVWDQSLRTFVDDTTKLFEYIRGARYVCSFGLRFVRISKATWSEMESLAPVQQSIRKGLARSDAHGAA